MKLLTIIVHTQVQQDLTALLRSMEMVSGFSFSAVEGHGMEIEKESYLAAKDDAVGHVPRVRVDILLQDEHVDSVLSHIRDQDAGVGQGVFWVTPVEQGGHLL
ncbi:MAG: DUF3240 family protein [Gammaproteobacteria bacterium]|nr:DUF3240 family protein [Gammaproteobacteria bacterium]MDH5803152.1 DUF3240 family protein [Gammaproteobacteria bacterium]